MKIVTSATLAALLLVATKTSAVEDGRATMVVEPFQQSTSARYRLFPTTNMWTFIELDTATGRLWQVQYAVGSDGEGGRFTINNKSLAQDGRAGRFSLYQTPNVWNFLLLDQEDGRVWQAQYSLGSEGAGIIPIEDVRPGVSDAVIEAWAKGFGGGNKPPIE